MPVEYRHCHKCEKCTDIKYKHCPDCKECKDPDDESHDCDFVLNGYFDL